MVCGNIAIYSDNWVHSEALAGISILDKHASLIKLNSATMASFLKQNVDFLSLVVIDAPPRGCADLIYRLRKLNDKIAIIFVQNVFLFSDKIVADYFGGIRLVKYKELFSISSGALSVVHLGLHEQCNNVSPICVFKDDVSITSALRELSILLYVRFSQLVSSSRVQEIVFYWLLKGMPPISVARALGLSDKVIYHYRSVAMRALNVRKKRTLFLH